MLPERSVSKSQCGNDGSGGRSGHRTVHERGQHAGHGRGRGCRRGRGRSHTAVAPDVAV